VSRWLANLFGKPVAGTSAPGAPGAAPASPAPTVLRSDPANGYSSADPGLPAARLVPWTVGAEVLGGYMVKALLGRGAYGEVYLLEVEQPSLRRFAAKRLHDLGGRERRAFMRELILWSDLPDHPNLVPFHFFTSEEEDQLVLFTDYVDGGDLAQAIDVRRFGSAEQIIDVAIQFAFGLHIAHEHGLVHQDVKPANVLLTKEGVVRVADFGLMRAHGKAGAKGAGQTAAPRQSTAGATASVVAYAGETREYRSPEQARGQDLGRATDQWSWAISVMELFAGEHPGYGETAAVFLESYLQRPKLPQGRPQMPVEVAKLLRRCFQEDPAARFATMLEAAQALMAEYRRLTGKDYPRPIPQIVPRDPKLRPVLERHHPGGAEWHDPQGWIRLAHTAGAAPETRPDALERATYDPRDAWSRRSQAVAELGNLLEARALLKVGPESGRNLSVSIAKLSVDIAWVHEVLHNRRGAMLSYNEAIATFESLVIEESPGWLRGDLAATYGNKANLLQGMGQLQNALALYNQCVAIYEKLVHVENHKELSFNLAGIYVNAGNALQTCGKLEDSVNIYRQAMRVYEELIEKEGQANLREALAATYMNVATVLQRQGKLADAIPSFDKCIAIREDLVHRGSERDLRGKLARSYINKAIAFAAAGHPGAAVPLLGKAIAALEELVRIEGRHDFLSDLANAYVSQATAFDTLGEAGNSLVLYRKGIEIYEQLIYRENRSDLRHHLAAAYMNNACAAREVQSIDRTLALFRDCIEIYQQLVYKENRLDMQGDLARAYMNEAIALRTHGRHLEAVALYDKCIPLFEKLADEQEELREDLAAAYMNKAIALAVEDQFHGALALMGQCVATYRRLVDSDLRHDLLGDLAEAQTIQARMLKDTGDATGALGLTRSAIATLESEVRRTGRADLKRALDRARRDLMEGARSSPGGAVPNSATGTAGPRATLLTGGSPHLESPNGVRQSGVVSAQQRFNRNDPCPCGSGKRYKHCHGRPT